MAIATPSSSLLTASRTPAQVPGRQNDPAYAGEYGYRALGAYSSGLDSGGNIIASPVAYKPQPSPVPGSTPTSGSSLAQQQLDQAGRIWDAQKQSWRTGDPNIMIGAVQDAMVNDANRFERKLGIPASPVSATFRIDRGIHRALNQVTPRPVSPATVVKKLSGGTVICTELARRGDATPYDLALGVFSRALDEAEEMVRRGICGEAQPDPIFGSG